MLHVDEDKYEHNETYVLFSCCSHGHRQKQSMTSSIEWMMTKCARKLCNLRTTLPSISLTSQMMRRSTRINFGAKLTYVRG